MKKKLSILFGIAFFLPLCIVNAAPLSAITADGKASVSAYKKAFSQNRELSTVSNDINYDIESFSINEDGTKISFSGWSYVDHMDNVGGQNLRTWLVAYIGDWDDSWSSLFVNSSKSSLSKGGSFYGLLTTTKKKNLFFSRATSGASSSKQLARVNSTSNHNMQAYPINGRNGVYTIDWCLQHAGIVRASKWNGGHSTKSRCVYYNVGFSVTFNLDSIISAIGESAIGDKEVKFRIISSAAYQQNKDCNADYSCTGSWTTYYKTNSSDLGVYKDSCEGIFGKTCSKYASSNSNSYYEASETFEEVEGDITYLVTRSFSVNKLSNQLEVTINNASPCKNETCSSTLGNGVFKSISYGGLLYTISGVKGSQTISRNGGSFSSRVYKLKLSNKNLSANGNTYTGTCNGEACGYYQSGNAITAYIPASWAKVSGSFSLKVKTEKKPKITPCAIKCIGGDCEDSIAEGCPSLKQSLGTASCSVTKGSSSCGNFSVKIDNSDKDKTCTKILTDTYYYRIEADKISDFLDDGEILQYNNSETNVKYDDATKSYYFPITFYSMVTVNQETELTLDFPANTSLNDYITIASGRFFKYSVEVSLHASWDYKKYTSTLSENNDYDRTITVNIKDGSSSTYVPVGVMVRLKDGDKLYKRNNNSYSEAIVYKDVDVFKRVVKDQIGSVLANFDFTKNIVNFSNSNDATSTEIESDAGEFTCQDIDGDWINKQEVNTSCSYKIKKAYIKTNGSDFGEVVYSATDKGIGYKESDNSAGVYFIPLNLKSDDSFKFNVDFSYLSLVKNIEIKYITTCSVKAKNELIPDSDTFRYRPIDESDPFPTGDIPSNWSSYISENNGLKRITERSFNQISYQTKKLSSLKGNIDSEYGIYSSLADMKDSGQSAIINSNYFEIINATSGTNYCTSKHFDSSCDKEVGTR